MVKAPTEVQDAIELRMHHCHGDQRPTQHLKLLAATATLQSTGHLVAEPLPSYPVDIDRARALGYPVGPLTEPQLRLDWDYHSRILGEVPNGDLPAVVDRTDWPTNMAGMIENPTRSSFFRDTPNDQRGPSTKCSPELVQGHGPEQYCQGGSLCPLWWWSRSSKRGIYPL